MRGKSLSASAVINFKVPQTVQLFRAGNSVALCLIGIPEGQTASTSGVDVTIVYGGVTQPVVHKEVRIKRFTKIRE